MKKTILNCAIAVGVAAIIAATAFAASPVCPVRPVLSSSPFHRVEERGGKWAMVAPDGTRWKMLAIEKANMNGPKCEKRGGVHPYGDALRAAGVSRREWAGRTAARLRDWGFNMLGTSCDSLLRREGFVHAEMLAFGARVTKGAPELCIRPWRGRCCEQFPNVFHPRFAEVCEEVAAESCGRLKDDPSLVGYYLDNELCWWGEGDWFRCGMLDYALRRLPAGHSAREAAERTARRFGFASAEAYLAAPLAEREPARTDFTREIAERYFRTTTAAIRRHDPNHLVLGCRFAGVQGAPDEVWRIAGKHCDIVSFNCYPKADLANKRLTVNIHWLPPGAKRNVVEAKDADGEFARLHALAGKPLFITEWSFAALDAGLPCTRGCGDRLATQSDRAAAVSLFLGIVNSRPYMVGSEWFMWVDDPPEGVTFASPEDCNYGLVNAADEPYAEVVEAFRRARERGIGK